MSQACPQLLFIVVAQDIEIPTTPANAPTASMTEECSVMAGMQAAQLRGQPMAPMSDDQLAQMQGQETRLRQQDAERRPGSPAPPPPEAPLPSTTPTAMRHSAASSAAGSSVVPFHRAHAARSTQHDQRPGAAAAQRCVCSSDPCAQRGRGACELLWHLCLGLASAHGRSCMPGPQPKALLTRFKVDMRSLGHSDVVNRLVNRVRLPSPMLVQAFFRSRAGLAAWPQHTSYMRKGVK